MINGNEVHWTDFLSVPEAAELLGVSRVTIHRWIQKDKLRSVRIGKSRFVLKTDIQTICNAQDGKDMEARLGAILARRTPGWSFSFVGELKEHGPNTMVALGPDGERITFRFEIIEQSEPTKER